MRTFRIVVAALGAFAVLSSPIQAQEAEPAGATLSDVRTSCRKGGVEF